MIKKEHLLYYLTKGEVRLSKKDYNFFNNLNYIIKEKKHITSNQNNLFDKLVVKYQRQLDKLGHKLQDVQQLNWSVEVVVTSEEYTVPKIFIDNEDLCLRVPFNKNFISKFTSEADCTFEWQKNEKFYKSKFYTHSLRTAIDTCKKYFDKVEYCDKIKELIEPLQVYEGVSTVPTLVKVDGKFQITNLNRYLQEAIKDIELNDDPKTLHLLSRYGIAISKDVTNDDPFLIFASQFITRLDLDVMINNPKYFSDLGITDVLYTFWSSKNVIDNEIRNFCTNNNIKIHTNLESINNAGKEVVFFKRYFGMKSEEYAYNNQQAICKVVEILNSRRVVVDNVKSKKKKK
jgi:hypothetical protein